MAVTSDGLTFVTTLWTSVGEKSVDKSVVSFHISAKTKVKKNIKSDYLFFCVNTATIDQVWSQGLEN